MQEISRNKGFVVNENGEIIRNRKCPKCGRSLFSEGGYCEYCGAKINGGEGHTVVWVCVEVVVVIVAVVLGFLIHNGDDGEEIVDKDRVINIINTFNEAYAANDFSTLSSLYSENVTRYYDASNLNNAEVVDHYRNYDSRFGVYAKHISVRWESLQIERISDDSLSVVFVEDYSIDRVDNSKYSIFVLEEHLILDKDYKIKSIYDVLLSKKRKKQYGYHKSTTKCFVKGEFKKETHGHFTVWNSQS